VYILLVYIHCPYLVCMLGRGCGLTLDPGHTLFQVATGRVEWETQALFAALGAWCSCLTLLLMLTCHGKLSCTIQAEMYTDLWGGVVQALLVGCCG
jgi:hypothetical protein